MNLQEKLFAGNESDYWRSKLDIPNTLASERILASKIVQQLDLQHQGLEEVALSVRDHVWLDYDEGKYFVEIPNFHSFAQKLKQNGNMVVMADIDDTLFNTTMWHQKEYAIILNYLHALGVGGEIKDVAALYELSKIHIPRVAEAQTRYTPLLNLILIDQFARRQRHEGMNTAEALYWMTAEQNTIQGQVRQIGEGVLHDYRFDEKLLATLLTENPPSEYLHIPLIYDLFGWDVDCEDNTVLRVIITRGKIEGPLGQVYKVHQSGMMTLPSIDAVVYTNDIKVEALLSLNILLPRIGQNRSILLYDDNPSEIVPFYERLAAKNPLSIELIHTRHATSKRRNKKVMVPDGQGNLIQQEPLATIGYAYHKKRSSSIESFDEAPSEEEATIFDHHTADGKGLAVLI